MADTKISALPSASTPLTGAEVLPIVQSGGNFKVSVADLTTGRAVSVASLTASGGTANGVTYLNASKSITSGTALTFDGTNLGIGTTPLSVGGYTFSDMLGSTGAQYRVRTATADLRVGADASSTFVSSTNTSLWFGANNAEGMRLTSTGLGIGTSSPSSKLHVATSGTSNYITNSSNTADGSIQGIVFVGGSLNRAIIRAVNESTNGGSLQFLTYTGGTGTQNMTLTAAGNLGIGTTSPAYKLDVNTGVSGVLQRWNTGSVSMLVEADHSGNGNWFLSPQGTSTFNVKTGGSTRLTVDSSGNLLVGQTGTGYVNSDSLGIEKVGGRLVVNHLNGTASGTFYAAFGYNAIGIGSITQSGTTAVLYNTSSDYRLKNITGPITTSGAYIDSLKPVEGTWKADGSTFVGLIAHETQEVSRTTVATGTKDGDEMQGMDYSSAEIIANLIAELQSLRARVAQLESK